MACMSDYGPVARKLSYPHKDYSYAAAAIWHEQDDGDEEEEVEVVTLHKLVLMKQQQGQA